MAYGLGNLGSVVNMLKRIGSETRLVSTPEELLRSERILLPGIGAFDTGMRLLNERRLVAAIKEFAASGKPIFGICLGMQLLLDSSEEGQTSGLGLVPGRSELFQEKPGLRIPHMGWNSVDTLTPDPLIAGLPTESRFYFVHSYRVVPRNADNVLGTTRYGEPFASMIRSGNVMGAQFHPEKSHEFGKQILRNFANL